MSVEYGVAVNRPIDGIRVIAGTWTDRAEAETWAWTHRPEAHAVVVEREPGGDWMPTYPKG